MTAEKTSDGFKWFGEGFDGFPKTLPEDCVEYTIHIIDSKLSNLEKREQLRKVQAAGLKLTSELTRGFIWQREGFDLALEREAGEAFLQGRTNYGDSVEDEWLVVYILRELSRKFPQIWIRVVDNDGQFLLIEAAGVLPRWLNPEVADYRVWLHSGKLLIIGLAELEEDSLQPKSNPKVLSLGQAIASIEHHPSDLIDLPQIQAEALYRLQKYPGQIADNLHHALVSIPRKLAYILHEDPAYVSPAVEAFYLRDPIALRPLQAQDINGLVFPPRDFVRVSTKFTKVGYAQLKSQHFDPPKLWVKASPFINDPKSQAELELGMKLTNGFEMLVADPQNQDSKAVREIKILLEDIDAEEVSLPSDATLRDGDMREDDEKWLDINFEDFEKELGGKNASSSSDNQGGFGHQGTHDHLRKMVSRFEEFLNDEAAGAEGAEYLDDMDEDDDDDADGDGTLSEDSEPASENQDISFDEDEFTSMMKEMMGMPSGEVTAKPKILHKDGTPNLERTSDIAEDDEDDNDLHEDMHAIEKELKEAGALQLNPEHNPDSSIPLSRAIDTRSSGADQSIGSVAAGDAEHEDLDIDYNLAKNLLESFKSQGGVPGPGGSLMGLMGMQLPRDEYEKI